MRVMDFGLMNTAKMAFCDVRFVKNKWKRTVNVKVVPLAASSKHRSLNEPLAHDKPSYFIWLQFIGTPCLRCFPVVLITWTWSDQSEILGASEREARIFKPFI